MSTLSHVFFWRPVPILRAIRILFDNLFAEESRNILVDMRIPALDLALLSQEVLQVDVQYFDPITRRLITLRPVTLSLDRTLGDRPADDTSNPEVEVARVTFAVSEVRHGSLGLNARTKSISANWFCGAPRMMWLWNARFLWSTQRMGSCSIAIAGRGNLGTLLCK